jgi:ubiquinone/menaquinone biosynthesis C-methylase UbiE
LNETLTFTGERFLPEVEGEISYEHWHRYAFAQNLCPGKVVLDVACGEGYGSSLLAEKANKVVGVDISEEAISHAKKTYRNSNLEFILGSCDKLPFPDNSFDLAVSYETIEHIETQEEFLAELVRVLKPEGHLVLSSPNKHLYSDAHDHHNEFHVKELYRDELKALLETQLKDSFPHIYWLGQKLLFHSAIWPEEQDFSETNYLQKNDIGIEQVSNSTLEPMYYLVVCSQNAQDQPALLDRLSLFAESSEVIYQDYCNHIKRVLDLDKLLKDREEKILERDKTLLLRTKQMKESERLVEERDALLTIRTKQTVEIEEQVRERDELLELRTGQLSEKDDLIAERDDLLVLRTEQLVKRDGLIDERDKMLALRNEQLLERDKLIVEREGLIVERDELLQLRNQQMIEREEMIEERDAQIKRDAEKIEEQNSQYQESERARHEVNEKLRVMAELAAYRNSLIWWLKLPWQFLKTSFSRKS